MRAFILLVFLGLSAPLAADTLDANREMVKRGVQAVLSCNGLFTSNRSLKQVFEQELAYMGPHIGTPEGGDSRVETKSIAKMVRKRPKT